MTKALPGAFQVKAYFIHISVSVSCKATLIHPSLPLPSLRMHHLIPKPIIKHTQSLEKPISTNKSGDDQNRGYEILGELLKLSFMEIKVEADSNHVDEQNLPLLKDKDLPEIERKTLIQRAISQTFQSTAHLANLLPTGTVLAFQLLAPIFSNQGNCDPVSRSMTAGLIALCGLSCFLMSFTDSFRDKNGNVFYGFATIQGLWIIDGSATISPEIAAKYRIRFIDFVHAFMSILVFAAVAVFDQNVVNCFYPLPSQEAQEVLTSLPVGIGVICSMLFVVFPTQRNGIGFPLSAQ